MRELLIGLLGRSDEVSERVIRQFLDRQQELLLPRLEEAGVSGALALFTQYPFLLELGVRKSERIGVPIQEPPYAPLDEMAQFDDRACDQEAPPEEGPESALPFASVKVR